MWADPALRRGRTTGGGAAGSGARPAAAELDPGPAADGADPDISCALRCRRPVARGFGGARTDARAFQSTRRAAALDSGNRNQSLLATADGVVALDARVILHDADRPETALPVPAIRSYPQEYA